MMREIISPGEREGKTATTLGSLGGDALLLKVYRKAGKAGGR